MSHNIVKETGIEEITLKPLPENEDEMNQLNDIAQSETSNKDDYVIYLEKSDPL